MVIDWKLPDNAGTKKKHHVDHEAEVSPPLTNTTHPFIIQLIKISFNKTQQIRMAEPSEKSHHKFRRLVVKPLISGELHHVNLQTTNNFFVCFSDCQIINS